MDDLTPEEKEIITDHRRKKKSENLMKNLSTEEKVDYLESLFKAQAKKESDKIDEITDDILMKIAKSKYSWMYVAGLVVVVWIASKYHHEIMLWMMG